MIWLLALLFIGCMTSGEPVGKWVPIPQLTAPSYRDVGFNNVQNCVNWYPQQTESGYVLRSTIRLGYRVSATNNAAGRGIWISTNGTILAVNGNKLYKYNGATNVTELGTLSTSTGRVQFAEGLTQILIVDGTAGYTCDKSGGAFAVVADANYPDDATSCTYMDSRFVVNDPANPGKFFLSGANDATLWTPILTDGAVAVGDALFGVITLNNNLWLLGKRSFEVWYDTGNSSFPFERINGAVFNYGIDAPSSYATNGNSLFALASTSVGGYCVLQIDGMTPKIISTPFIEQILNAVGGGFYIAYCYRYRGCDFFELNYFTGGNSTLTYCVQSGAWIERKGPSGIAAVTAGFAANYRTNLDNIVAISNSDGKYLLPWDGGAAGSGVLTLLESNIVRVRDFTVAAGLSRTFHSQIRIELETTYDFNDDLTLSTTLQYSEDGGATFGPTFTMSTFISGAGSVGKQVILKSPPLGSTTKDRVYRLTFTGPDGDLIIRRADLLLDQGRF